MDIFFIPQSTLRDANISVFTALEQAQEHLYSLCLQPERTGSTSEALKSQKTIHEKK